MPSTTAKPHAASPQQAQRIAALIAAQDAAAAIAERLQEHGLAPAAYERLEDLPELCAEEQAPAIAVLVAHEQASLARELAALRERLPGTPVMVVCPDIQRWGIRTALTNGAAGVVLLTELDAAFGPCLRAVTAGQICVPQAYGQQVEPPALSSREKQILGLVVMGYMNSQIAERLYLAESTVKSHLSSAFSKLGVRSRNEAVSLILDPDRGLGMGILALVGDAGRPTAPAS